MQKIKDFSPHDLWKVPSWEWFTSGPGLSPGSPGLSIVCLFPLTFVEVCLLLRSVSSMHHHVGVSFYCRRFPLTFVEVSLFRPTFVEVCLVRLTFVALVVARWLGFTAANLTPELEEQLMTLIQIGLGGYVVGRSAEKVAKSISFNRTVENG